MEYNTGMNVVWLGEEFASSVPPPPKIAALVLDESTLRVLAGGTTSTGLCEPQVEEDGQFDDLEVIDGLSGERVGSGLRFSTTLAPAWVKVLHINS